MRFSILVLVSVLSTCHGAGDQVCTEIKNGRDSFQFNVPKDFTMDIEAVYKGKSPTVVRNLKMYYSSRDKIIRVDVTDLYNRAILFFNFKDNQILYYDLTNGRGACNVIDKMVDKLDDFFLSGLEPGKDFPVPLSALHFIGKSGFMDSTIKQASQGTAQVRGKTAKRYTSCQKWKDVVLNVTHYFADEKYHFTLDESKLFATPLKMTISGLQAGKGLIDQTYNYFYVREGIHPKDKLETPADGVLCPGRKTDKTFPELPDHIRFTTESIDYPSGNYFAMDELYDYRNKYAAFRSPLKASDDINLERIIRVQDFSTNQEYQIDATNKLCSSQKIENSGLADYAKRPGSVSMDDPQRFFKSEIKNFVYIGPKTIRGIVTDTWVVKPSYMGDKSNAVIQWNFATGVNSWNDANPDFQKNKWPMLVQYKFWPDELSQKPLIQNFFHVDYTEPRVNFLDLSECFPFKSHFRIVFAGRRDLIVNTEVDAFKYEVVSQVTKTANVTWLHVNRVKLYYTNDDVIVEFIIGTTDQLPFDTNRFLDAIHQGTMEFKAAGKTLKVDKVSQVFTYQSQIQKKDDPLLYTDASMAGLGVGMFVLGAALGVGAGFMHDRFL